MGTVGFMIVFIDIFLVISISCNSVDDAFGRKRKPAVSAVYVFGDSTTDPGNNNFIGTPFTSDFPPYGQDLPDHQPTGRFSNGRLVPDFMAAYAGVKDLVPPYLDPNLSFDELMTGVSFGSGGSGYDPLTPKISGAISIQEQLSNFREYKSKLTQRIGKNRTDEIISKALYIVGAGTNDFFVNYITLPPRKLKYTLPEYEELIVQYVHQFTQGLLKEGAKKIILSGLPPIGCLPIMITLYSKSSPLHRGCMDSYNAIARSYNRLLTAELAKANAEGAAHGVKVVYYDIYTPVYAMIQQSDRYGFEEVTEGCCGTGLLETTILCNSLSWVCEDASKYIFFDSIHPTEKAYYIVFTTFRPGLDHLFKE